MKMILFILVFALFLQEGYAQQAVYRDSVNTMLKQTKKGNKIFNDNDKEAKRHYYYHKKSNQIVTIITLPNKSHSAVYYDFLNNELVKMIIQLPYSAMPSSIGKKMHGAYYFKDGVLTDKDELNFPVVNIEKYRNEGLELQKRAVLYLKSKSVFE